MNFFYLVRWDLRGMPNTYSSLACFLSLFINYFL
ncbi:unnamed protein product [Callosobruchus maculatus]|uniref:Uncharacterized protein n=1 Tax=Callosobruchus maculatus TaxID=64391 RepID=A0A653D7V4_CALMS|nr:unnamed protein product [Callosobruchus maculatus]